MDDIQSNSTIWKVIIRVEKEDMRNATKLCGDARKECDQLYRTINMQGTKAIDRLKEFITTVEKQEKKNPNIMGKQLQTAKTDFEKVILPFLKENVRSKQKASNQVTPKKRSDVTKKEYLTVHVEHFRDTFGDPWGEAHDALTSHGLSDEKIIAGILLEVVQRAFTMNKEDARRELIVAQRCAEQIVTHGINVEDDVNINEGNIAEEIRAYRYLQADRAIPRAQKNFLGKKWKVFLDKNDIVEKKIIKHLEEYAMECVEVTWYLCAEDPPVCMVLDEGTQQQFDETLYEPSTKRGAMIDYILWPALKQSENGPVLVKGKVECKN